MRREILAGAIALALAAGMTTSAMAFDHRGAGGHHWRHSHSFVGGYGARPYGSGGYTDLGPLGFTLGRPGYCGPNCVPGSSIAAWSW
jgi:hypothetical protein